MTNQEAQDMAARAAAEEPDNGLTAEEMEFWNRVKDCGEMTFEEFREFIIAARPPEDPEQTSIMIYPSPSPLNELKKGPFDIRNEIKNRKLPITAEDGRRSVFLHPNREYTNDIWLGNFSDHYIASGKFEEQVHAVKANIEKISELAHEFWPNLLPALIHDGAIGENDALVNLVIDNPKLTAKLLDGSKGRKLAKEIVSAWKAEEQRRVAEEIRKEVEKVADVYGNPYDLTQEGSVKAINYRFWGRMYANQFEEFIFEPDEKRFYPYTPETGLFEVMDNDTVRENVSGMLVGYSQKWALLLPQRFTGPKETNEIVTSMKGILLEREAFVNRPKAIHLANCMLMFNHDAGQFERKDFSPTYRSRAQSPLSYDPDAECPEFMERMFGHIDPDDIEIIQKYGGQCLLGSNLMQKLLLLLGEGGASKGAIVSIITLVIGRRNVGELRTSELNGRFEVGRCVGKSLLTAPDVKPDFLTLDGADKLKAMVGGDLLTAELKSSNAVFDLNGEFNAIVTANSQLNVKVQNDRSAWARRMIPVTYGKSYKGKTIPNVHEYLINKEGSGILNFFIEGARKLLVDIKEHGKFVLNEKQQDRVDDMLNRSVSLELFVKERIVREDYPVMINGVAINDSLTTDDIMAGYVKWCHIKGWRPWSENSVMNTLPGLMQSIHGVARRNDIRREGSYTSQRGYKKVFFRSRIEAAEEEHRKEQEKQAEDAKWEAAENMDLNDPRQTESQD
jgi:putative DNA primase/helicase